MIFSGIAVFWEIAHCILHCKVGGCVTTLKTKKNKKNKKIKVVSWAITTPKIVENCIFKDNPNVHIVLDSVERKRNILYRYYFRVG